MTGILSDIELQAFEAEEMHVHYKDGPCGVHNCPFCYVLEMERVYFDDYLMGRTLSEDLDELHEEGD